MVTQQHIDDLQTRLQALRAAVVRPPAAMSERIDRLFLDARRLRAQAPGSGHEPSLTSIENLLGCIRQGLAEDAPAARYRRAG